MKRRCMLKRHFEKMAIKLARMLIFLASLTRKNSIQPLSISELGACWQDGAFKKNAHAYE